MYTCIDRYIILNIYLNVKVNEKSKICSLSTYYCKPNKSSAVVEQFTVFCLLFETHLIIAILQAPTITPTVKLISTHSLSGATPKRFGYSRSIDFSTDQRHPMPRLRINFKHETNSFTTNRRHS